MLWSPRKTGISALGLCRRIHKDPRLNSNRGQWADVRMGQFCVRKKLSIAVNLACFRLQDSGENRSKKVRKTAWELRSSPPEEREWPFSLTHVSAALVLLSLLVRFFRSTTLTESLAQATTRDKGTILTIMINVFCTLLAKLLSRNHVWKSFINDFLRVPFHHASALQLTVDVLLHVLIIGRLSRRQWLLNTKQGHPTTVSS